MNTLLVFGIVGQAITKGVDAIRTGFDKEDRVPKVYWLLLAQAVGIAVAYGVAHSPPLAAYLHVPLKGAFDTVLVGVGLGGVSSFLHELNSALSARSGAAATPKGLKPTPKAHHAPAHNRREGDPK
jgi:hypothetical protein